MKWNSILEKLPYQEPFLFVDRLLFLDAEEVEGEYRFRKDSWFYRGHFRDRPITPGVLLTECCAQIGLACLGLYPVYPGEKVRVKARKEYFRFGKLKSTVKMYREDNQLICKGTLSGMLILPTE